MRFLKVKRISAVVLAWIFFMGGIFWDVSPVRAEAGDISSMFDSSPDNTWLFAGGTETQGRYEEIQGRRNFTGDIEESIRKGNSGGAPEHQRYTINAGKAGRDLQGFLDEMDDYVQRVDPKAVSYLIEEEDYGKGEAGRKDFRRRMPFPEKKMQRHSVMRRPQRIRRQVLPKIRDALKW